MTLWGCCEVAFVTVAIGHNHMCSLSRVSRRDLISNWASFSDRIMFIAIVGTRFSGRTSIENYLVSLKGFTSVRIIHSDSDIHGLEEQFEVQTSFLVFLHVSTSFHRSTHHRLPHRRACRPPLTSPPRKMLALQCPNICPSYQWAHSLHLFPHGRIRHYILEHCASQVLQTFLNMLLKTGVKILSRRIFMPGKSSNLSFGDHFFSFSTLRRLCWNDSTAQKGPLSPTSNNIYYCPSNPPLESRTFHCTILWEMTIELYLRANLQDLPPCELCPILSIFK